MIRKSDPQCGFFSFRIVSRAKVHIVSAAGREFPCEMGPEEEEEAEKKNEKEQRHASEPREE